jgi:hypothetical protein
MNGTSGPGKDLDAFMSAFSYPARQGLLIQNVTEHPVHPRADRGNSAAYISFLELKTLEAHVSEIPPGEATGLHSHLPLRLGSRSSARFR